MESTNQSITSTDIWLASFSFNLGKLDYHDYHGSSLPLRKGFQLPPTTLGISVQPSHVPGDLFSFATAQWLQNTTPSQTEWRFAFIYKEGLHKVLFYMLQLRPGVWVCLGLVSSTFHHVQGSWTTWQPAKWGQTVPELLPQTQAGSKPVAPRWKHLLGSTVGVYLNRWPCGERLRVPLPTAGWQADLFLWALKAHTVGPGRRYGGNLPRPCSFFHKMERKENNEKAFWELSPSQ